MLRMTRSPSSNSGGCSRSVAGWSSAVLAAVVLLVTIVSLFLPKRYEASSRLLLDLEGPDDLGLEQVVMPIGLDMNTKLETQIRIVQSDTIATSVIKQLGLHRNKDIRRQTWSQYGDGL